MADTTFPESPLEFAMFDWIESSDKSPAEVFDHKMRLVEMADKGGLYGWHITEHHGTPLSLNVSPSVMLASAFQRTKRLRMGPLTYNLPWYNPYRLYNEICMLDQLSHGRLDLGVGRGIIPLEGALNGIDSPEESRSRYREALDIILTGFRSDVLDYEGQYNSYKGLDLYNRPFQQPYPPLWFPTSNATSIEFIASHGYNTVFPGDDEKVRSLWQQYREVWLEHKDDPDRHNGHVAAPKLSGHRQIVVADTDAEAEALAAAAIPVFTQRFGHLLRKHGQSMPNPPSTRENRTGMVLTGSPKTVAQVIVESVKVTTMNYFMLVFSFGGLTHEQAEHSLDLFIKEAMPAIHSALGSKKEAVAG